MPTTGPTTTSAAISTSIGPSTQTALPQTGVLVEWGVSGEMSTEVCGAEDLHPDANIPEGISNIHVPSVGETIDGEPTRGETMHGEPQKLLINGIFYIKINNKYYTIL